MRQVKSCGVLLFRREPKTAFLLLRHRHRYDLPKGHLIDGETEQQCALRELREETGIGSGQVRLDPAFRFTHTYYPRYRRFGNQQVEKTVVLFLGWLEGEAAVEVTEHEGHEWVVWAPPHRFNAGTIDQLLAAATSWVPAS